MEVTDSLTAPNPPGLGVTTVSDHSHRSPANHSYSSITMEDPKNIKDDKKEKESPELKEELNEEEVKGVDGGVSVSAYPLVIRW